MRSREQLAKIVSQIVSSDSDKTILNEETINDYKKLNDKCDIVINKIKNRKKKSNQNNTTGE